jgi:hypothetical protein
MLPASSNRGMTISNSTAGGALLESFKPSTWETWLRQFTLTRSLSACKLCGSVVPHYVLRLGQLVIRHAARLCMSYANLCMSAPSTVLSSKLVHRRQICLVLMPQRVLILLAHGDRRPRLSHSHLKESHLFYETVSVSSARLTSP